MISNTDILTNGHRNYMTKSVEIIYEAVLPVSPKVLSLVEKKPPSVNKLDGVGPIDNRPSTD